VNTTIGTGSDHVRPYLHFLVAVEEPRNFGIRWSCPS